MWVGFFSADGRHDHDANYRVNWARRMFGMIARSWSRGKKDRRGRSSLLSLPLRLRLTKAHVDLILPTFRRLKRAQAYALRRVFGVDRFSMQEDIFLTRC